MTEGGQATVEIIDNQEIARTQSPTIKNYALELPTFGAIVGVSQTEVQWNGHILEEPPTCDHGLPPYHVCMPSEGVRLR